MYSYEWAYLHICFCVCMCGLAVMVFQLVGSHAELVSDYLEILNTQHPVDYWERKKERGGKSVCWFLHEDWNSLPRFTVSRSLTLDILLEPSCVCVCLTVYSPVKCVLCIQQHAWQVSEISEGCGCWPLHPNQPELLKLIHTVGWIIYIRTEGLLPATKSFLRTKKKHDRRRKE